ncbi:MAG: Mur ligase family protein [Actinomycetota bacterium]
MPSALKPSTATEWVASLSPWPEEFGLDRMRQLLTALGEPQRAFPAVHVVGTNGKSTATRTIAGLLRAEGLRAGAYTSPHVSGWHERLDCDPEAFERAVARIREPAEELGATQFEALTAAAFAEFADVGVDVAVVEAGLGGRLDATNVVDAPVVLLTNVALEHTEVLGDTAEQIAKEKLAVAHAARVVVISDNTYRDLVPPSASVEIGGAREAAQAFLERPLEHEVEIALPGRLERRGDEVWDGAHTPEAVDWLLARLPAREYVLCVSILGDKRIDELLSRLARAGRTFVATRSSNPRALPEKELAATAERHFENVEALADPHAALARARELGDPVLVTGSLYLLADLYS